MTRKKYDKKRALTQVIYQRLSELEAKKYTGELCLTVPMRAGGIGGLKIKQDEFVEITYGTTKSPDKPSDKERLN